MAERSGLVQDDKPRSGIEGIDALNCTEKEGIVHGDDRVVGAVTKTVIGFCGEERVTADRR